MNGELREAGREASFDVYGYSVSYNFELRLPLGLRRSISGGRISVPIIEIRNPKRNRIR